MHRLSRLSASPATARNRRLRWRRRVKTILVEFADYGRDGRLADHGSGSAHVFDDAIEVVLAKGVFPFKPDSRLQLIALSAVLAYGDTANWSLRRESSKVFVSDMHVKGDTLQDSVTFWVRGTRGVDLTTHWLLLTEDASMYLRERSAWAPAMRPIYGDPGFFRKAGLGERSPNER